MPNRWNDWGFLWPSRNKGEILNAFEMMWWASNNIDLGGFLINFSTKWYRSIIGRIFWREIWIYIEFCWRNDRSVLEWSEILFENWAIGLIELWFLRMKIIKGNQFWTIRPEYMENTCYGNVWFNVWCYADPMLTFLLKLVLQFNLILFFTSTIHLFEWGNPS